MPNAAAPHRRHQIRLNDSARPLSAFSTLWKGPCPPTCSQNTELAKAVALLLSPPSDRLLLVTGPGGKLVGTLTWGDLYEDLFLTLVPPRISPAPGAHRPKRTIRARDLMSDAVSVQPSTPLDEALRLLYRNKLKGLPVVDRRGRPVGYLRLAAIQSWLRP